jgi:osmotically-inducible protein OsmY
MKTPAHTNQYSFIRQRSSISLKAFILAGSCILLSSCLSGIWTGANLFYDRHNVYNSFNDFELSNTARNALYADDALECPECHIDLAVFNGDILLAGHLENAQMRDEAYRRVMAKPGYRRLFKEISIEPIRTNLRKDSWITTKIRSKIIADSEINPHSFKIVTSDQIVYLMGDVMPDQAEWVTTIARETSGVRRVVKLLKYYHLTDKPS